MKSVLLVLATLFSVNCFSQDTEITYDTSFQFTISEGAISQRITIWSNTLMISDSTGVLAYKDSVWHINDAEKSIELLITLLNQSTERCVKSDSLNESYKSIIRKMYKKIEYVTPVKPL